MRRCTALAPRPHAASPRSTSAIALIRATTSRRCGRAIAWARAWRARRLPSETRWCTITARSAASPSGSASTARASCLIASRNAPASPSSSGSHRAPRHHHAAASCVAPATSAIAQARAPTSRRSTPAGHARNASRADLRASRVCSASSSSKPSHALGLASSRASCDPALAAAVAPARSGASRRRGGRSRPTTGGGLRAAAPRWRMDATSRAPP
jgi:hypothetical protein